MPMEFDQLASYIWLQQAFLAFFAVWILDNEIFEEIRSGNVAYELCRPLDLYNLWFVKTLLCGCLEQSSVASPFSSLRWCFRNR